ncbi:hypothetical protein SCOR_34060 [Sulfidibacter corallicola]|uniref:Uncharacterized protein n=1 Tax=Sulfidibacter corallicola TaxID=2818388 RepID=A0A8A4THA3_SULCO|nr:hypothetical protein [Sulfidibacter corallicola]QTD49439.1 hypothetical protein J3U87_27960 [Sulfidibacter corallicola]
MFLKPRFDPPSNYLTSLKLGEDTILFSVSPDNVVRYRSTSCPDAERSARGSWTRPLSLPMYPTRPEISRTSESRGGTGHPRLTRAHLASCQVAFAEGLVHVFRLVPGGQACISKRSNGSGEAVCSGTLWIQRYRWDRDRKCLVSEPLPGCRRQGSGPEDELQPGIAVAVWGAPVRGWFSVLRVPPGAGGPGFWQVIHVAEEAGGAEAAAPKRHLVATALLDGPPGILCGKGQVRSSLAPVLVEESLVRRQVLPPLGIERLGQLRGLRSSVPRFEIADCPVTTLVSGHRGADAPARTPSNQVKSRASVRLSVPVWDHYLGCMRVTVETLAIEKDGSLRHVESPSTPRSKVS